MNGINGGKVVPAGMKALKAARGGAGENSEPVCVLTSVSSTSTLVRWATLLTVSSSYTPFDD